jgi:hypothetical protein
MREQIYVRNITVSSKEIFLKILFLPAPFQKYVFRSHAIETQKIENRFYIAAQN